MGGGEEIRVCALLCSANHTHCPTRPGLSTDFSPPVGDFSPPVSELYPPVGESCLARIFSPPV
eukprot:4265543-Pyramimonas_sp.AAC.1